MFRRRVFPQPQVPAAAYAIPILANAGVKEQKADGSVGPWQGSKTIFQEYRAKGGLIGFAPDPRTGHECGDSQYLAIPFFDAVMGHAAAGEGQQGTEATAGRHVEGLAGSADGRYRSARGGVPGQSE